MTIISDTFNNTLKSRVDGLCYDLANLVATQPDLLRSGSFQPQSQGSPQQGGGCGQQQDSYSNSQQQQNRSGPMGPASLFMPPPRIFQRLVGCRFTPAYRHRRSERGYATLTSHRLGVWRLKSTVGSRSTIRSITRLASFRNSSPRAGHGHFQVNTAYSGHSTLAGSLHGRSVAATPTPICPSSDAASSTTVHQQRTAER